jgi:hypothetical protein
MSDTALIELAPLLKCKCFINFDHLEIVEKKCKDVREALRKFRDQMMEFVQKGITNGHLKL